MNRGTTQTNPQKATLRLAINAFMIGSVFIILTIILTLGPKEFSAFVVWQIVLAIPLLFISSMAYVKISYKEKSHLFDRYAWVSHTLGNNMILNAFGLIAAGFSKNLGWVYFASVFTTVVIYYVIDIIQEPSQKRGDIMKIVFIGIIFLAAGIYPLLLI